MSEKLDTKKCPVCGNEECSCENIEVCPSCENTECICDNEEYVCKEVSESIRRKIQFDFEEYPEESFCECGCGCDCNGECEGECICDIKKSLAVLGATVATVAVAGGILYLVKRKK